MHLFYRSFILWCVAAAAVFLAAAQFQRTKNNNQTKHRRKALQADFDAQLRFLRSEADIARVQHQRREAEHVREKSRLRHRSAQSSAILNGILSDVNRCIETNKAKAGGDSAAADPCLYTYGEPPRQFLPVERRQGVDPTKNQALCQAGTSWKKLYELFPEHGERLIRMKHPVLRSLLCDVMSLAGPWLKTGSTILSVGAGGGELEM